MKRVIQNHQEQELHLHYLDVKEELITMRQVSFIEDHRRPGIHCECRMDDKSK